MGAGASLPHGWDLSNYLYVIYDRTQADGTNFTTATVSFDLLGSFSWQRFHCEGTGTDLLVNSTGSGSRYRNCAAKDDAAAAGYNTSFRYKPGQWDVVNLREMSTCGTDPRQMSTVLFKGDVTDNYFRSNSGDRPEPPEGGANVQHWTRTYYNDYSISGRLTLVPPAPTAICPSDFSQSWGWEVENFSFVAACNNCPPAPWTAPDPGYRTQFRLRNLATGYEVDCYAFASDLPIVVNKEWNFCGVDPDDAPFLPPTWFRMNRGKHMLDINQTWTCETDSGAQVSYNGRGGLYVPWDCNAEPGPGGYGETGCSVSLPTQIIPATIITQGAARSERK